MGTGFPNSKWIPSPATLTQALPLNRPERGPPVAHTWLRLTAKMTQSPGPPWLWKLLNFGDFQKPSSGPLLSALPHASGALQVGWPQTPVPWVRGPDPWEATASGWLT